VSLQTVPTRAQAAATERSNLAFQRCTPRTNNEPPVTPNPVVTAAAHAKLLSDHELMRRKFVELRQQALELKRKEKEELERKVREEEQRQKYPLYYQCVDQLPQYDCGDELLPNLGDGRSIVDDKSREVTLANGSDEEEGSTIDEQKKHLHMEWMKLFSCWISNVDVESSSSTTKHAEDGDVEDVDIGKTRSAVVEAALAVRDLFLLPDDVTCDNRNTKKMKKKKTNLQKQNSSKTKKEKYRSTSSLFQEKGELEDAADYSDGDNIVETKVNSKKSKSKKSTNKNKSRRRRQRESSLMNDFEPSLLDFLFMDEDYFDDENDDDEEDEDYFDDTYLDEYDSRVAAYDEETLASTWAASTIASKDFSYRNVNYRNPSSKRGRRREGGGGGQRSSTYRNAGNNHQRMSLAL
jgi:hypothetical protein